MSVIGTEGQSKSGLRYIVNCWQCNDSKWFNTRTEALTFYKEHLRQKVDPNAPGAYSQHRASINVTWLYQGRSRILGRNEIDDFLFFMEMQPPANSQETDDHDVWRDDV